MDVMWAPALSTSTLCFLPWLRILLGCVAIYAVGSLAPNKGGECCPLKLVVPLLTATATVVDLLWMPFWIF